MLQGTRLLVDGTSLLDVTETMTTVSISTELAGTSSVSIPSIMTSAYSTSTAADARTVTYTLNSVTSEM